MNIDQCYDKLRSIGCSVETSDALASIIADLSDKKREAFFLWACGMTQDEASKEVGIPRETFRDCISKIRQKC